ncbi:hypothetical protein EDI_070850 [Entamoeba dispar SAW760]|uniref:BRCT domain-containing protein n=1 Tax=Entamoeba dispar (strain ATCC PRA-260 / SAW760) TaxID=370354 RepID=B0EMC5_ENTDS|nr:uncharacterized protein EDI_070850 [Entamoeba dispar SAW760]EDR24343.1 hypothetical protein EDI_070850 [Entamoeba dispar SAW760]|eukprot:EDR24343.1 hypothetical protein EDI_070850 [Entamoeba dispar SAW760]
MSVSIHLTTRKVEVQCTVPTESTSKIRWQSFNGKIYVDYNSKLNEDIEHHYLINNKGVFVLDKERYIDFNEMLECRLDVNNRNRIIRRFIDNHYEERIQQEYQRKSEDEEKRKSEEARFNEILLRRKSSNELKKRKASTSIRNDAIDLTKSEIKFELPKQPLAFLRRKSIETKPVSETQIIPMEFDQFLDEIPFALTLPEPTQTIQSSEKSIFDEVFNVKKQSEDTHKEVVVGINPTKEEKQNFHYIQENQTENILNSIKSQEMQQGLNSTEKNELLQLMSIMSYLSQPSLNETIFCMKKESKFFTGEIIKIFGSLNEDTIKQCEFHGATFKKKLTSSVTVCVVGNSLIDLKDILKQMKICNEKKIDVVGIEWVHDCLTCQLKVSKARYCLNEEDLVERNQLKRNEGINELDSKRIIID